MSFLELKVPPPLVALICAVVCGAIAGATPDLGWEWPFRLTMAISLPLALLGLAIDIAALRQFRTAATTINPMAPDRTVTLVTGGIYARTRNPMYDGMALLLLAVLVWLQHPLALVAVVLFVLYITRFQIVPEERILAAKFGQAYTDYKARTRRWLWAGQG